MVTINFSQADLTADLMDTIARGLRTEARTVSSAGHVDPVGSTQAGRVYDHESP